MQEGKLLTSIHFSQVATAAFAFPLRLGSGGFVAGYKTALPKDEDGKYAVAKFFGALA